MAEQKPATQGLTIYLLKSSSEKVEDAIRENIQNLSSHRLKAGSKQFGHLFVQQKAPKPPKWARFFANHLDPKIFGVVSNASAVLFMESAKGGLR